MFSYRETFAPYTLEYSPYQPKSSPYPPKSYNTISAYFLLRGRNTAFARRSMTVAASFGLASALSVVVLGDESGYVANNNQKMKIAAIEAMWNTEEPPASLTVFGIPNEKTMKTDYALEIPYALGLMVTRTMNTPVPGISELVDEGRERIKEGMLAYAALSKLRTNPSSTEAKKEFDQHSQFLGYGLLLKKYTENVVDATEEQINQAARDLEPHIMPLFFSFRIMVACGFFFILLFATGFYLSIKRKLHSTKWFLRVAFYSLPLPWIAAELGWIVAEYGRQPWVVQGILPTSMATSSLIPAQVITSLAGFILFYSVLAVIEVYLMVKYIRLGPEYLEK